jgi:hypothetical protein
MKDFESYDWSVYGRGYLSMGRWEGDDGTYRHGLYRHPAGLVEVYEQVGDRPHVSMRFRWKGRDYSRDWKTSWGDKTIARLAREMIEDTVKEWAKCLSM